MEFIASIDQLHSILKWIQGQLEPMKLNPKTLHKIELASEEALVNIVTHAYQGRSEKVEIMVHCVPKSHAEIVFQDHGPFFNPLDKEDPLDAPLLERKIGGLGIHLIKQCVDEVHYQRAEGKNILTFLIRSS